MICYEKSLPFFLGRLVLEFVSGTFLEFSPGEDFHGLFLFCNLDVEGSESHGVHLCHKCGWPFPNPHPSAKHRRAHKKICGTIEGYKLSFSEGRPHLNGSDDEHVSDDDHKTPGEFPSYV